LTIFLIVFLFIEQITKIKKARCYELKLLELSNRTTLILSNTRELDRVPSTSSLPYILLLMVRAYYHAPYPK